MFLSTPLVRYVVNGLHQRGMLDQHHCDSLVRYDLLINSGITVAAALAAIGILVS